MNNKDIKHLQWIHDRLINVYGESENVDFLIRLREIIRPINGGKKTTDELVDIIISEVGAPLPTYDYHEYKKYISTVPQNINIGDGVRGILKADMHDTFREGCVKIIEWHNLI